MKGKNKSGRVETPLAKHKREGKKLVPPMLQIPNMVLKSWGNDRLPEMIWAALLINNLPREKALNMLRKISLDLGSEAKLMNRKNERPNVTLSHLLRFPQDKVKNILSEALAEEGAKEALRPLLIFPQLPGRDLWESVIGENTTTKEDIKTLEKAVLGALSHQSELATDCRWVKTLFLITSGHISFPSAMEERLNEVLNYPNQGDLRSIRPFIRATEGTTDMLEEGETPSNWPDIFWDHCFSQFPCYEKLAENFIEDKEALEKRVNDFAGEWDTVVENYFLTIETTSTNPKHDTIFGMVLYGADLVASVMIGGTRSTGSARIILRVLAECLITLKYLTDKDDPKLWKEFRDYGSGQAKLMNEKIIEGGVKADYLDPISIREIANEDAWTEFVSVNLGHWENRDLRKISEDIGMKDIYNKYYIWPSGYMHGNWAAIRESVFQTCFNPLHRLHCIPRVRREGHQLDATNDFLFIWNELFQIIVKAYPGAKDK